GTSRAAAIKLAYAEDRERGENVLRFIHHVDNPTDRRPLPKVLATTTIVPSAWYKILLKIDLNHSGMPGSGHLQFWMADCGGGAGAEADWGAEYELLADVKGDTIQNLAHEALMIKNRDVEGFTAEPSDSKDPVARQRHVWTTFGFYHPCQREREFQIYFDEIRVGDSRDEVDPFRSCSHDDLALNAERYTKAPKAPWQDWARNADAGMRRSRFPFLYVDDELSDLGAAYLDEKYIAQKNFLQGRFDSSMITFGDYKKWRNDR
ncbi:MAG: hypothetical protein AAF961_16085, partial [Planctomycetota bacterium]